MNTNTNVGLSDLKIKERALLCMRDNLCFISLRKFSKKDEPILVYREDLMTVVKVDKKFIEVKNED